MEYIIIIAFWVIAYLMGKHIMGIEEEGVGGFLMTLIAGALIWIGIVACIALTFLLHEAATKICF